MKPIDSARIPDSCDVIVVGAGLAGLACARHLKRADLDVHVIDASDHVGGRVRTDEVNGFRLDRGFQVILTAYEEVQRQFDLDRLDLRPFRPGSTIWTGERLETLGDPYRNPASAISTLAARVGSASDKLKVASLRRRLLSKPPAECFSGDDRSTLEELHDLGFSEEFIDGFFRSFLGGVFLERELETSAHLFRYYFRCFAEGDAAVPARGMQALPEQIASSLEGCVSLGVRARAADASHVVLDDGSTISADHVVVAADGASASALTGGEEPSYKPSVTAYYVCDDPPVSEPILILDGEGTGPVNHVAAMSAVSSDYAPPGRHLVAASGVGSAADDPRRFQVEAARQLSRWFGPSVEGWTHLKTYVIPHALPRHPAGSLTATPGPHRRTDGVIVAGDYTEFGSLQGALSSGRRAAEGVLELRPVPKARTGRARPTTGTRRPEPSSSTGRDR